MMLGNKCCPFIEEVDEEATRQEFMNKRTCLRLTIDAGLFSRNSLRMILASEAHMLKGKIDIKWTETSGLLSTVFCVETTGKRKDVKSWESSLKELLTRHNSSD